MEWAGIKRDPSAVVNKAILKASATPRGESTLSIPGLQRFIVIFLFWSSSPAIRANPLEAASELPNLALRLAKRATSRCRNATPVLVFAILVADWFEGLVFLLAKNSESR
jgi:hypothetical protein